MIDESRDVADQLGQPLTTAHLLLCLFMVQNRASVFLSDHQVTVDRLMDRLGRAPSESERTWDAVMQRAHETALISGSPHVSSLHVLVALCSFVDSSAYQLISALDLDMGTVRSRALAHLNEPPPQEPDVDDLATVAGAAPLRSGTRHTAAEAAPRHRVTTAERDLPEDEAERRDAAGLREPPDIRRRRRRTPPPRPAPTSDPTRDLAKRLFDSGPRKRTITPSDLPLPPSVRRSADRPEAPRPAPTSPAAAPGTERSDPAAPHAPANGTAPRQTARPEPGGAIITRAPLGRPVSQPIARPSRPERRHLVLRDAEFPTLAKMGRNLTLLAFDGEIDAVVGRDDEIERLVDILNKRRANNPLLVGEAGVGKTAVVEGLARRMVGADGEIPPGLAGRVLVELEASKVLSGTGLRGSFSERIQKLKAEVARARGRIVLFLDELHHWIGAGAGDGAADGAGELKTALARGEFPCIGATTFDEYSRFVEGDPAFARRFQRVRVEEPSPSQAVSILTGVKASYEAHHRVEFELDALDAAVRLTHRYLPDRRLPDKAIGVLDLAGSRARRTGAAAVTHEHIARVVAELAGVSPEKLLLSDRERFATLGARLSAHLVGHASVVERVAQALRRNYAGFVSGRPIGTFLFLGPTGVGKTEFAKALARVLFEDPDAMLRFDMSEFMESHSVARLIGSPPGYVGHDSGGQLTEGIRRRPYQLVLFDEVEKAHSDVLNLLIQLLDEGRLTDSRGRTVDFSNTVVVMTSNLGADEATSSGRPRRVGFGGGDDTEADDRDARVLSAAKAHFRPELWNRIQERLVFLPLSREDVRGIAELQLRDSCSRLRDERRIAFDWTPRVIDHLIENGGFDPAYGARPMRRTIERLVEGAIANLILGGEARAGATLHVDVDDDAIVVRAE